MEHYTKDDLLNEIRGYMWALADCLGRVYRQDIGWEILGLNKKDFNVKYDSLSEVAPETIDPRKFHVTRTLLSMYEYGVDGIWDTNENWEDFATDTLAFIDGLHSFFLLNESGIDYDLRLSTHVTNLATARWKLDSSEGTTDLLDTDGPYVSGSTLTLGDVALLANMDEKSVRNAANPKNKNHLRTFSRGARTYVAVEDARRWLVERRGFKPTTQVDRTAERDLTKVGFCSATDFGSYLVALRANKGQSISQVVKGISEPDLTAERLKALEKGVFEFDKDIFFWIAKHFGLNKKAFVLATLALHQKIERASFETSLEAESE